MSFNKLNNNHKIRYFSEDGNSSSHSNNSNKLFFNNITNNIKIKNMNNNKISINNIDNYNNIGSMDLQLNNEKNTVEKNTKINLFSQIKKLLTDFEKEKTEKKKFVVNKNKNGNKTNSKKVRKLSTLLVPQKKVYYITPKVKNQMQLNHYLINDFKEVDSEQAYVKRSLKYQKMNDDLDELVYLNQMKEVAKNGISENVINDYDKKDNEFYDSGTKLGSYDYEINSNNSIQTDHNKNSNKIINIQKNIEERKRNTIFNNNNNYDFSLRKLYTENFKDTGKKLSYTNRNYQSNNIIFLEQNQKKIFKNQSITSRTKNSENENSITETNDRNRINKSTGIKFLMGIKSKNSKINLNTINITNNMKSPKKTDIKQNKKKKLKKEKEKEKTSIDRYAFSNKVYKTQKLEYNKYLKNKQIMRGKNFSKQIALLLKEKERYGLNDNENDVGGLPRLNYSKLLYQMQLKDLFTNSFNTLRLFNEGDQDLDLDNLNKIKQLIKDYEIEMARVMKNMDNSNYIKKRFNKSTVGKFQSSRGIYM